MLEYEISTTKIKEDLGPNFIPVKCDVLDPEQIKAACDQIETVFDGKLDVLINNAGGGVAGSPENFTLEQYEYASHLLLRPGMLFTKYTVQYLRKSDNPSICHTSSIGSYMSAVTQPETLMYGVFKMALSNYACNCAGMLAPIRVNAICPGLIMSNIMPKEAWDMMGSPESLAMIPSGRIADVSEVAKLVAHLSSEKAKYITGDVIKIDGGWYTTHARIAI